VFEEINWKDLKQELQNFSFNLALRNMLHHLISEKPSFASSTRPETLGEYGTIVTLPCEAVGVPSPNIVWFRNTERVETIPGNR
jgi:hypothetical protein